MKMNKKNTKYKHIYTLFLSIFTCAVNALPAAVIYYEIMQTCKMFEEKYLNIFYAFRILFFL